MATAIQSAPVPAHELHIEPKQLPRLRSNAGQYVDDASVAWMRPTPVDTPMDEIRRRFEEDGYVHMKGVIPREDVYDLREQYFKHMSCTGILKPGTSPRDGIFNPAEDPTKHNGVGGSDLPEDILKVDKLVEAHTLPIYHAFLEHPYFRGFIKEFMGWERDVLLTRTLLRHNVPHGQSTGIHYDRIFLRVGAADFLTAWVPIGDCAAAGGGLMYLADSTTIGRRIEQEFMQAAKDFTPEERIFAFNRNMARDGQLSHDAVEFTESLSRREGNGQEEDEGEGSKGFKWLIADYEAGDVVFHNPYLIHGSAKNEDPHGRIRLSTDLRFYEEGADMDTRWMQTFRPNDGL